MASVRHDVHDQEWLRQRTAAGLDRFDEVWDGVLHVVPPPSRDHQRIEGGLLRAFFDRALERGCEATHEIGVFDPREGERNFRVPDLAVYRLTDASERGVEGRAELAVEIRSPRDETYLKSPFYAQQQVQQILVIHPDARTAELYDLDGAGYRCVEPDAQGVVTIRCLDAHVDTITTDDGPRLRVTIDDAITLI